MEPFDRTSKILLVIFIACAIILTIWIIKDLVSLTNYKQCEQVPVTVMPSWCYEVK